MPSTIDIAWTAGFLEGEGSFTPGGYGAKRGSCPWVSAAQVQAEPLERLKQFFGGSISWPKEVKPKRQQCGHWVLSASRAAGLMMTLYLMMSPRRKSQIIHSLSIWKQRPVERKYRRHCPQGHAYDEQNTYLYNGSRTCRKCNRMRATACNRRKKEEIRALRD